MHVHEVDATTARATVKLIARDFDDGLLEQHVALVRRTAEEVSPEVEFEAKPQYSNMRQYLDAFPEVVERAAQAIRAEGVEVVRVPIRGGTDGSILSARGLPTPNLFTGGHEYHSKREWASVQDMASAAAEVCASSVRRSCSNAATRSPSRCGVEFDSENTADTISSAVRSTTTPPISEKARTRTTGEL